MTEVAAAKGQEALEKMVAMDEEEASSPSRYGFDRCVYTKDKDVVDHQVVNFEYPSGVTASFSLDLFSPAPRRRQRNRPADERLI